MIYQPEFVTKLVVYCRLQKNEESPDYDVRRGIK